MRAFKLIRKDGLHYYVRSDFGWRLHDRPDVVSVEEQEETPYVRAAIIFYEGVAGSIETPPELREAIISRMIQGECLWHASAQETGRRCFCADCTRE